MQELPWVKDGTSETEREAVEHLLQLAVVDVTKLESLLRLGWVKDDITDTELDAIKQLNWLTGNDGLRSLDNLAVILKYPWLQDGITEAEGKFLDFVEGLDDLSETGAAAVMAMPWTQDDITGTEAETVKLLRWLGDEEDQKGIALIETVLALGWVQDDITETEKSFIEWLEALDEKDEEAAALVIATAWAQDSITETEREAMEQLYHLAGQEDGGGSNLESVLAFSWMQDDVTETEKDFIYWLEVLDEEGEEAAAIIVAMPWVLDGVDNGETEAVQWLSNVEGKEAASSLVSLVWLRDGVDEVEVKAIEQLSYVYLMDGTVAAKVTSLDWVQDSIEDPEVHIIDVLGLITREDAGEALRIAGMPFLETVEPPDMAALRSLWQLAATNPEIFAGVMSHEALSDGISDDTAPIVAILYNVARVNPLLIEVLLYPSRVQRERRIITLPLAGSVTLDIIRTAPGAARSMDLLEQSVLGAEDFMGVPFPTRHVALLYESAFSERAVGSHFGSHIAVSPRYDTDDGSSDASYAPFLVAHEVAHYYWTGNMDWLDEGAADLMAVVILQAERGRPIAPTMAACSEADSIAELESLDSSKIDAALQCNYALGNRLFVGLKRKLGDERFQQGFQSLYLASRIEGAPEGHAGIALNIQHVREAFRSDDGAENGVIARWYDGTKDQNEPSQPRIVESQFGTMRVFEDPWGYIQAEVPAEWVEEELEPGSTAWFTASSPDGNSSVFIQPLNIPHSLEETSKLFASAITEEMGPETEISSSSFETAQGLPAILNEYLLDRRAVVQLLVGSYDGNLTNIMYYFPADQLEAGRKLAHYSFDTFWVN